MAGGTGTDTILGPNTTNAWTITGTAGAGTGTLNGRAFSAIENLTGGSEADNLAIKGMTVDRRRECDHIVTTAIEEKERAAGLPVQKSVGAEESNR